MADPDEPRLHDQAAAASDAGARLEAVRFAIANTMIEGGRILPETELMMTAWARGEIDDDALLEQALERFGPGAAGTMP